MCGRHGRRGRRRIRRHRPAGSGGSCEASNARLSRSDLLVVRLWWRRCWTRRRRGGRWWCNRGRSSGRRDGGSRRRHDGRRLVRELAPQGCGQELRGPGYGQPERVGTLHGGHWRRRRRGDRSWARRQHLRGRRLRRNHRHHGASGSDHVLGRHSGRFSGSRLARWHAHAIAGWRGHVRGEVDAYGGPRLGQDVWGSGRRRGGTRPGGRRATF